MDYGDFEVQLGPNLGGKLLVRVLQAPLPVDGSCECQVDISALSASWRGSSRNLTAGGAPGLGRAEAANLDSRFFEALFTGDVLELLSACLLNLPEERGLRICLRINPGDPTMAPFQHVRWELLARKGQFLALNKRTPIVRTLQARSPRRVARFGSPTRVLLVASQPYGTETLALSEEIDRLRAILRKPRFELEVLKNPDIREFRSTLVKGNFHIFHYMGHGDFDEESGDGVLLFHDVQAPARRAHAWHLATAVKDLQPLSLVVLNACSTARFSSGPMHNPFAGLASSFLNSGIPCVVAMQSPIEDQQAIQLSSAFYENLAEGASIEEAVTEARKAILDVSPETADWSIPVLFLSTSDSPAPELPHSRPTTKRKFLTLAVLAVAISLSLLLSGFLVDWSDLISHPKPPIPEVTTEKGEPGAIASAKDFLRLLAENKMTEAFQRVSRVVQQQGSEADFVAGYRPYALAVSGGLSSREVDPIFPIPAGSNNNGTCLEVRFVSRYGGAEAWRMFEFVTLCREVEQWKIVRFFWNSQPVLPAAKPPSGGQDVEQRALAILEKLHDNRLAEVYRDDVAVLEKAVLRREADFVGLMSQWVAAFPRRPEERQLLALRKQETEPRCLPADKKAEMSDVVFVARYPGQKKFNEEVIMIKEGDRWMLGCVFVAPSF